MSDVFISYAREDRARAEQVARGLQAAGLDVFWDSEIPPGQTWSDYIEAKLARSKVMVVLWSEISTGSQWVREEARIGRDRGKLIPAMLDASPAPFGFGEVQSADLSGWHGEPNHPQWTRFLNAVTNVTGQSAAEPRAQSFTQPRFAQASAAPATGVNMSPIDYVKKCLRLYVDANGRARRAEYWWWILFVFVASLIAGAIDAVVFGYNSYTGAANVQAFSTLVGLGLLAPGVCVGIRRFHDAGFSGWLFAGGLGALFVGALIAAAIPALGGLIVLGVCGAMIVILVLPGKPGENAYGPNPKGV